MSITYCVCVCSISYPACNAYAPYCHLWPAPPYSIFPHSVINGTILEEKIYWNKMRVLTFSKTFVRNISCKKNWARCDQNVHRSAGTVPLCLPVQYRYVCRYSTVMSAGTAPLFLIDCNDTWIFLATFLEIVKFHENPSNGGPVVPCGQTDGQTTWRS